MSLRSFLGVVALLAIVAATATVGTTGPAASVLNVEVKSPVTTSSIAIPRTNPEPTDHRDLLPPQTTTTKPATTTTEKKSSTTGEAESGGSNATTTTKPPAASSTTAPPDGAFNSSFESSFFSNINSLRAADGLDTLNRNSSLDAEARAWAQAMALNESLTHSDLGRLIPPWSAVAENVGNGSNVSSIFSALSASSGHLSNMVGDYTDVGIGVWVDADGVLWTTHLFTK